MATTACVRIPPAREHPSGVDAEIDVGGTSTRIRYSGPGLTTVCGADAAIAIALLPAMRRGLPIVSEDPVSPQLLGAVPTIERIIRSWAQRYRTYGLYQPIEVEADTRGTPAVDGGRGVAAFFTGGVDSFYSVLQHRGEIDALVYVCGFDVAQSDVALTSDVLDGVRAAAAELDLPLLVVDTDLRAFSNRYAKWDVYHGAALASVALLLAERFRKVYVPATQTYAYLAPLGSHPLLDPLWSTEELEIVHDGCEASRIEKIEAITTEPAARRHLRVCWENRDGRYNCGSCEKCLRTMVAMSVLGVLDSYSTFPHTIGRVDLARVRLPEHRYTWDASLELLEDTERDPTLARDLRRRLYGRPARALHQTLHYAHRVRTLIRK